jgi:hypothetical protein
VPVRQGNQASPILAGTYTENVASKKEILMTFATLGIKAAIYTIVANDRVVISVPVATLIARAGYLDAAIMSYVDGLDGVEKKLGSLGLLEMLWNTQTEFLAIFTKDVPKSFLTSQAFISASVNTFVGTVSAVYFVIELPDSWGPVSFLPDTWISKSYRV